MRDEGQEYVFLGVGPVAEVEHEAFLLGLDAAIAGDGGEGAEEETGGVSHDRSAARSDFVSGLELIEFAEGVVDGHGIAEFPDVADENGSEVGLMEFFLGVGGVFGAEAGIRIRNGHAAAASVGSALLTMGRDRIGNGDGCFGLRVHGSSFRR
ncbi:MAG TPA: hypothetical protein VEW05_03245 [Candidatus Polarisedimenticolia bacterium]|nr:hypothetical protein [Candidatus Polarisedimenticolia bacterium]